MLCMPDPEGLQWFELRDRLACEASNAKTSVLMAKVTRSVHLRTLATSDPAAVEGESAAAEAGTLVPIRAYEDLGLMDWLPGKNRVKKHMEIVKFTGKKSNWEMLGGRR